MVRLPYKLIITVTILCSAIHLTCSEQWYEHGNPHFINEQDYKRLVINAQTRNKGVTILKFFTPWCRYCKYLKDIIDQLRAQQQWEITIYEVNCNQINYNFCGSMGVRSFPKMAFFENGVFQESLDGFYPYPVVRELFLKYNRTNHAQVSTRTDTVNIRHHQQQVKETQPQQTDFIEPQIIEPDVNQPHQQQHQQNQQPPIHPVQPQHEDSEKPKVTDSESTSKQEENHNRQQQHVEPVQVKQQKPTSQTLQQPQTHQETLSHAQESTNKMKRTEQMIEQEQNIVIVDQNIQQTQNQKKIVQEIHSQTLNSIDLTKILPGDQDIHHYGKYMIYAICIFVGGYYFVNIMKADPHHQHTKSPQSTYNQSSYQKNPKSHIPTNISIQDSQLRQQLNFQHQNEEEVNFNSIQIRDQDL